MTAPRVELTLREAKALLNATQYTAMDDDELLADGTKDGRYS